MYFDQAGKMNTENTLQLAFERGKQLGLREVVVPSTTGNAALQALEIFKGFQMTVIASHAGYYEPFRQEFPDAVRRELQAKGVTVLAASHALSGIERSIAKRFNGMYPALLIAEALRLFGQGTKVAVELSVMAADAGALTGSDIIALGGTSSGLDTALVVKPAHQSNFFDIRIREIICKPRFF